MNKSRIVLSMRTICSWCNKVLADDGKGGADTHGICSACAKKM